MLGRIDQLTEYVRKHLTVKAQSTGSNVIDIQYVAGSPAAAAVVANAIVETYVTTIRDVKSSQDSANDAWIAQQTAASQRDIEQAEAKLDQFVQAHNLPEVQGSLAASVNLVRLQDQLNEARAVLAKQQAAYDTLQGTGHPAAAAETLDSKTIIKLKELEATSVQQLSEMGPIDPRRARMQAAVAAFQQQIRTETNLIAQSIRRDLDIAKSKVASLEQAVQQANTSTQAATVAGTKLKQLTSDLEAKRAAQASFLTQAARMRVESAQSAIAQPLFIAVPPLRPRYSYGLLSLMIGFVAGGLGASATIVSRTALSNRITSGATMATATGVPVVGCLPDFWQRSQANALLIAETLRATWLAMQLARPSGGQGITCLVTSAEIDEGKTTVASELSLRIAADGFRVLLIEGDLRRPQLASTLKMTVPPNASLETVLTGSARLEDAVVRHADTGLECLLSTGKEPNALKLLLSGELPRLLDEARVMYDLVVIDSSPVLRVADAVVLAKRTDHVLFVVQAGRMTDGEVHEAMARFGADERSKMRALLTRVQPSDLSQTDYYGGYSDKLRLRREVA
ncbi:MAG: GumC family protein [Rhodopila sp.]